MSITDKELLTICNLSNLQIEYANIIKGYKDGGKDSEGNQINIPINHTIYSLLSQGRNESNIGDLDIDFDKRDENKDKDYIINLANIFERKKIELESSIINTDIEASEKEIERLKILGLNSEAKKENKKLEKLKKELKEIEKDDDTLYEDGKGIIRSAPIVFDYLDNPKLNGFLKEWEIVYAENLQGIVINYIYEMYNLMSQNSISKEEFLKKTEIDKKIYKKMVLKNEEVEIDFKIEIYKAILIEKIEFLIENLKLLTINDSNLNINEIENIFLVFIEKIKICDNKELLDEYNEHLDILKVFIKRKINALKNTLDSSKVLSKDEILEFENKITNFIMQTDKIHSFQKKSIDATTLISLFSSFGVDTKSDDIKFLAENGIKVTKETDIIKSFEILLSKENANKATRVSTASEKIISSNIVKKIEKKGILHFRGKFIRQKYIKKILRSADYVTKILAITSFASELEKRWEEIDNLYREPRLTIDNLELYESDFRILILKNKEKYVVAFNNFNDAEIQKTLLTGCINTTSTLITTALNSILANKNYEKETSSFAEGIENLEKDILNKDVIFIGFGNGGCFAEILGFLYKKEYKKLIEKKEDIIYTKNLINFDTHDIQMINNKIKTINISIKECYLVTINTYIGSKISVASTFIITAVALMSAELEIALFFNIISGIFLYSVLPVILAYVIVAVYKFFKCTDMLEFLRENKFIERYSLLDIATDEIEKYKNRRLDFILKLMLKDEYNYSIKNETTLTKKLNENEYLGLKLKIINNEIVYDGATFNYVNLRDVMNQIYIKITDEKIFENILETYFEENYTKGISLLNLLRYYSLLRKKNLLLEDGKIKRKQKMEAIYIKYSGKSVNSIPTSKIGYIDSIQYNPCVKKEKKFENIIEISTGINFSVFDSQYAIANSVNKNIAVGAESNNIFLKKDLERIENAKTEDEKNRLREETKIDLSEIDVLNVFDDEYRFFPFLNGDNLTTDINDNFSKSALTSDVQSNYGDKPIEKVEKKEEDISSSKDKEVEKKEVPSEDKEIEKKEVIETTKTIKTEKEKTPNTTNSTTKANVIQYEVVKFPTEKKLEKNKKTIAMVETLVKRGGAEIPYLSSMFITGLERYFSIKEARNETEKIGTIIFNDKDEEQPSYRFHEATRFHNKKVELKIPLIEDPNDVVEDKTEVLDGAVLRCSLGADPSNLEVTTHNKVYVKNRLVATVEDCKGGENIKSFGECKRSTPCPCIPKIEEIWKKGSEKVYIKDKAVLLSNAKCICKDGGEIRIEEPLGKVEIKK